MNSDSIQQLAGQTFDLIFGLADRIKGAARLFFIVAAITGVVGMVLGLIALSGTLRTVWLVLGGLFAVVGIGAAYRSWKSLTLVIGQASELRVSIDGLLHSVGDSVAGVLDGVDVDSMGMMKQARLTRTLRKAIKESLGQYRDVSEATAAIAGFPAVAMAATVSIAGFSLLGVIFAIVIAV